MAELKFDISKVVEGAIKEFKHQGYHVSKWIGVDEALPVYNSRVIIYDVSKNIRIGIYTEIGWCSQYENPLMYKVTHWMPLPEPPETTKG